MNHYQTLGVDPAASIEEIAAAMRQLRKDHHPDREGGDHERMAAINAAFDVLSDHDKRRAYDNTQPNTERDALALLESIFNAALANDAQDLVVFTRIKLAEVRAQANSTATDVRRAIWKLEKRRARIKVKTGTNLVHALIDKRLETLAGQKAGCADTLLVVERAFALIGEYVDEPEAESGEYTMRQASFRLGAPSNFLFGGSTV